MRTALVLVFAALLTGCAVKQQRADRMSYANAECARAGYSAGSAEYHGCVLAATKVKPTAVIPVVPR